MCSVSKQTLFIVLVGLSILVGCTDNREREALEANHAAVGTQVADLRVSATIQAARAQTTLDFVQTRAAAAATQSQFLEATMIATGFAPESLADFRERLLVQRPTATPLPPTDIANSSGAGGEAGTPMRETRTPTLPAITPLGITPSAVSTIAVTINPNTPHLEKPVTATGVGNDDCATGVTSQFSSATEAIYIVADAINVPSGSTIQARWFRSGEPVGPVYDFTPDFDIEDACVWFFVDPTDFEFTAGQYAVDLLLNGEVAISRIPFTISDP
jgi:hypothetical protein